MLAEAHIAAADGAALPYRDGSFDLVLAFTSFSAMRADGVRTNAAVEILRVLRPGGLAVVYDFTVNPTNRATRSLRERELRRLFAEARIHVERVTLAPPIVRLLGGRPALCKPLERLPWLRTHLLAGIVKERA
jgi:SAM-dependent methyltransferase